MKPANFPTKKKLRQLRAMVRSGQITSDELESADAFRSVRTKKKRSDRRRGKGKEE